MGFYVIKGYLERDYNMDKVKKEEKSEEEEKEKNESVEKEKVEEPTRKNKPWWKFW